MLTPQEFTEVIRDLLEEHNKSTEGNLAQSYHHTVCAVDDALFSFTGVSHILNENIFRGTYVTTKSLRLPRRPSRKED